MARTRRLPPRKRRFRNPTRSKSTMMLQQKAAIPTKQPMVTHRAGESVVAGVADVAMIVARTGAKVAARGVANNAPAVRQQRMPMTTSGHRVSRPASSRSWATTTMPAPKTISVARLATVTLQVAIAHRSVGASVANETAAAKPVVVVAAVAVDVAAVVVVAVIASQCVPPTAHSLRARQMEHTITTCLIAVMICRTQPTIPRVDTRMTRVRRSRWRANRAAPTDRTMRTRRRHIQRRALNQPQ